jgi:hypothetical protein
MAYSTGGAINRIGGPGRQALKDESSSQKAPLGEKIELGDGRCFRYAKSAAAIEIAHVVAGDVSAGQLIELDATTTVSCTAGDKEFSITGSGSQLSSTAGFYNDAYLIISDGTAAGEYHHIKSHTTAASDKITFTLYDPVTTAFVAASGVSIVGNPYGAAITADGTSRSITSDSFAIGATLRAVQSGYYFWMQTRGVCALQLDGGTTASPAQGAEMIVSANHDGQVEAKLDANDGMQTVGNQVGSATDDDDYAGVFLSLE